MTSESEESGFGGGSDSVLAVTQGLVDETTLPPTTTDRDLARVLAKIGVREAPELIDERYQVEEVLGQGAMGVVYRARDQRLQRLVALKLVRSRRGGPRSAGLHARFEREARALAMVDHPNVVPIYDVGVHEGETYLTMQFVPGATLGSWKRAAERSEAELIDVYVSAARGLAAAHAKGIVHRDFKPENVLISVTGEVRVVDFGIAAAIRQCDLEETLDLDLEGGLDAEGATTVSAVDMLERLTLTGSLIGTPAYMAPEQFERTDIDALADQYALCVALWEALCGERPFSGSSLEDLVSARERGPVGGKGLSTQLRTLLCHGLAYSSEQRFENMDELIDALLAYRGRRRRRLTVAGISAALCAATLAGWGLSQAGQVEPETCDHFLAEVDAVWTPGRSDELAGMWSHDSTTLAYSLASLDTLAGDWRASAAGLCTDRGHAPAPDSRERECRSAWLERFDRSVTLLFELDDPAQLARVPDLLAKLRVSDDDYCAFEADPLVDPQVARASEGARELALLGMVEEAREESEAALARAGALALEGSGSVDWAEALVARAEVLARTGSREDAQPVFARAQAEALASGHRRALLLAALWRAKLISAAGGRESAELGEAYLELAEPTIEALGLGPADPRRGELELARGLLAKTRGELDDAVVAYERARALFVAAGLPTRAATALNGIGVVEVRRERYSEAREIFGQALTLLEAVGVPAQHRSRLTAHYNLGFIGLITSSLAGLPHLEVIAAHHPNPSKRLRALNLGQLIAYNRGELERARPWTERALAELERQGVGDAQLTVEVQLQSGAVLTALGDPRGEGLLDQGEAGAEELDVETLVDAKHTRIDSLVRGGECERARIRAVELEAFLIVQDPQVSEQAEHPLWREEWLTSACATPNDSNQQHN